jgi:3-methyladenine DNA glycosylase AlkC
MAEPFKNLINDNTVRVMGGHLLRVDRRFDRHAFEALALPGLQRLEFKARALQLCTALEATLPRRFEAAARQIGASLASPLPADGSAVSRPDEAGLTGWGLWAVGEFVARRGLDEPQRALPLLHAITQRFSAEFAIRPFILRHPAFVFETLGVWVRDPSVHVRRLVSEGSRPRLPWGLRLKPLIADPSPALPLLRALQDDPSETVRRSVANHLNDIAKDHPDRVAAWVEEHLPGASPQRVSLLRHASRSLIKAGHPRTLRAWGLGAPMRGEVRFVLAPQRAAIGDELSLHVVLQSSARRSQALVIDYALYRVLADGSLSPKVFKGWTIDLAPHEQRSLTKRHSLREVTTRRLYPGRHRIELRINGAACGSAEFLLRLR